MDDPVTSALNTIKNTAGSVVSGIGQGAQDIGGAINNVVSSWGKGLGDEWNNVSQKAGQFGQNIAQDVGQQAQSLMPQQLPGGNNIFGLNMPAQQNPLKLAGGFIQGMNQSLGNPVQNTTAIGINNPLPQAQDFAKQLFSQPISTIGNLGMLVGLGEEAPIEPSLPKLSDQYNMVAGQVKPGEVMTSANGIKYTKEALDKYNQVLPNVIAQQKEFATDPQGVWQKLLPQNDFNSWTNAQDMNHTPAGGAALKNERGSFTFVSPHDVPTGKTATPIMDHHAFDQFTANNGYPEVSVLRQTYDENGNPNPLEVVDGHHRFPIGRDMGIDKIPAVILDETKPLLKDSFNQAKGIQDMTMAQLQPNMAEAGNVTTGMKILNQQRGYYPSKTLNETIPSEQSLNMRALQQSRAQVTEPRGVPLSDDKLGRQMLQQARVQQNPEFYGTQATAPIKDVRAADPLVQKQLQAAQDAQPVTQIAQQAAQQTGARITARIKSAESMTEQMGRKGKTPNQVNDALGVRVIAPTQPQADAALEQIKANPDIKVVKQEPVVNPQTGYAANHLDVKVAGSPQTTEIQGMTDQNAQLADATHAEYKGQEQSPTDIPAQPGQSNMDNALNARFSVQQNIGQRADLLLRRVSDAVKGSQETEAFRQAIEHPENIGQYAQQARNPSKFIDAVNQFSQFTDYVHSVATQSGLDMGYLKDYYSHILDLSTPEKQQQFEEFMRGRASNYQGYFSKQRIFQNIDDLRANGFNLKNPTVGLDVKEYTGAAQRAIGNSAFLQELRQYKPNDVATITKAGVPVDSQGRAFMQSRIPGMSDTAFSPDLTKELEAKVGDTLYPTNINKLASFAKDINQLGKEIRLFGGGFHILNVIPKMVGHELLGLHIPSVDKMGAVLFSQGAYDNELQSAIQRGVIDKAGAMNVTLGKMQDIDENAPGGKINPLLHPISAQNQGIFGRLMNYLKIQMVDHANVDLTSPEGIKQARQIGSQINNMIGGINREVGDSILKTKGARNIAGMSVLAPDYQEGRIRNLVSSGKALTPLGNASDRFAAQGLMGEVLVKAALAVGGSYVMGKGYSNLQDIFQHAFLDPQIPFGQDQKGNNLTAKMPASILSDVNRAIQDPAQYAIGHMAALPSDTIKAITGKDFYGQQLTDPYNPQAGGPINTLKAIGASDLPIPAVQVGKLMQGKVNVPSAIANTVGLRVSQSDQNSTIIYEKEKAAAMKNLTPNQLAVFNTLNPQKIDPFTGNPITDPSAAQQLQSKQAKASLLLAHPDIMKAQGDLEKAVAAKTGQQSDPIYDLSPAQQQVVLTMRTFLPGQSTTEKQALINANPWYKDYIAKENQFYASLPLTQQVSLLPTTAAPASLQPLLNQYNGLPSGTGARTQFIQQHPQIGQYFQQEQAITAYEQEQLGLLPTGTASATGGKSSGGYSSSYYSPSATQSYLDRALLRQSLLMRIPTAEIKGVPNLFLEPGQQATSKPILGMSQMAMPQKPTTAIRAGSPGGKAPVFSKNAVQFKARTPIKNVKEAGLFQ